MRPAYLSEEAFKRGVPLGTECFRCFTRAYATVQKPNSEPSPKIQDSGENNHKHTAEEDMAWRCIDCELLLCGICKNDVKSDQELWVWFIALVLTVSIQIEEIELRRSDYGDASQGLGRWPIAFCSTTRETRS
jgi:hypothetical protein